jgi:hypothetical protein
MYAIYFAPLISFNVLLHKVLSKQIQTESESCVISRCLLISWNFLSTSISNTNVVQMLCKFFNRSPNEENYLKYPSNELVQTS